MIKKQTRTYYNPITYLKKLFAILMLQKESYFLPEAPSHLPEAIHTLMGER